MTVREGLQLDDNGWLTTAQRQPSPHCDARPAGETISLLVIHGISLPPGQFGGPYIEQLFLGQLPPEAHPAFESLRGLRVSAHFLIRRDGALQQFVSCLDRAWHAGQSQFAGRERCNDFSIGIELEGVDDIPYADVQYSVLVALIHCLQQRWPAVTNERIVSHARIAPGRKTDPGPAFDWLRLFARLAQTR